MRRLVVLKTFSRDLDVAWYHIAERNLPAAKRLRTEIKTEMRKLSVTPSRGHIRPDLPAKYRALVVQSYVIVFMFDDESVVLLRFLHGARDFTQIFPQD